MALSLIERIRTAVLLPAAGLLAFALGAAVHDWSAHDRTLDLTHQAPAPLQSADLRVHRTDAIPAVQAPQRARAGVCDALGAGMNPTWVIRTLTGQGWTQGEAEAMTADAEDGTSCAHD